MEAKNLYIIRHGQTEFNKNGMVQGSGVDSSLNLLGKAQAQAFFESFKNKPFDKIYVSKLKRTYESIHRFVEEKNIPFQSLAGLNEISWGEREGRILTADDDIAYTGMLNEWRKGNVKHVISKGESPYQVMLRQKKALEYIMSNTQEKNVLVAMHGRAIRILMSWLINDDMSTMDTFKHENLCLYKVAFENGQFMLKHSNYTRHLDSIKESLLLDQETFSDK